MGRFFFECPGGRVIYSCRDCKTFLSNVESVISDRFRGSTGAAFLFDSVINIELSNVEEKMMLTGRHMVRDASCKNCKKRVGWMYEFAYENDQTYKEGKVILERACIVESPGIDDKISLVPSPSTPTYNQGVLYMPSTPTSASAAAFLPRNSSSSSLETARSSPDDDRHRNINQGIRFGRRSFRGFRGNR
ncbi:yippee zinc-binding/DNA-binding /Mis18, centromere assembly domain-containing protein [Ditylenchus destructor]|nr:yippee zinc-binding/DNA-binding /Mis18, centromere assembly domain-containing protein [Ditylenchus destructor]